MKKFFIQRFENLGSTNESLKEFARKTGKANTVFWADTQNAGYGRLGAAWISGKQPGESLTFSLLYELSSSADVTLTLVCGLAILRALHSAEFSEIGLKWPNDLYWQGSKLGGILVEQVKVANRHFYIIGVGLNRQFSIKNSPSEFSSVDLAEYANLKSLPLPTTESLLHTCLAHLKITLAQWSTQGFAAHTKEWQQHDVLKDKPITFWCDADAMQKQGIERGINAQGALCIEIDNSMNYFTSGISQIRLLNTAKIPA